MNGQASPRVDTTRLQHLARGYTETAVFYAAIDLDLFTHVSAGASDVSALARAMNISELNTERLTVVCLALGLLERAEGAGLQNAADCEKYLVSTGDRYAGAWMTFTRRETPDWFNITEALQSREMPDTLGMYSTITVESARRYHAATYSIGMGAGRRFCRHVDLTGRRHLLDLGGGSGAYSINAVRSFDGLRATVLDLAPVTVVTQEYLEENGVADRVDTVGGDFIEDPLPRGCDVAIMASNLPIYDAERIQLVVQKTFDALEPGGEMHLIGETLHPDGVGPVDAAMWGMAEVLYGSGGRAHTSSECRNYFATAGFVDVQNIDFIPGTLTRTVGTKPG
ncbi:MAG: methyltransferase [Acidimicrobiales bacterium]|nr:methyltransferase [Acidimicrobiales bacterium]MDG2218830.1 methyltransferase [Acidimicrobiales bacterium]